MNALTRLHESPLASHVTLGECWARDGLQNEADVVPTERKVEMINGMVNAGFQRIEATNFAHPKYLPQFADAEAVRYGSLAHDPPLYECVNQCTTAGCQERLSLTTFRAERTELRSFPQSPGPIRHSGGDRLRPCRNSAVAVAGAAGCRPAGKRTNSSDEPKNYA